MNLLETIKSMPDALIGKGVDKESIEVAELSLGLSFSPEYRMYLENYGIVAVNGHELTGICQSDRINVVLVTISARQTHSVKDDWYVIEQANIDGIVIWQSSDGVVYQTAPNSYTNKICESLADYIKM